MTALCPGFTHSEFHDVMGTRDAADRLPRFMWQEPEDIVRKGWAAVTAGKPVCIPGAINKVSAAAMRPIPGRISYHLSKQPSPKENSPTPPQHTDSHGTCAPAPSGAANASATLREDVRAQFSTRGVRSQASRSIRAS